MIVDRGGNDDKGAVRLQDKAEARRAQMADCVDLRKKD